MNTKGIILAGGEGKRLFPITKVYSKQLTAVFDKPMIYYPLSTLISANIKDILIIASADMLPLYQQLFGDGSAVGLNISYIIQRKPNGIAESFILAEDFIDKDNVCLILGDNIFHGDDNIFRKIIKQITDDKQQAITSNNIFALYVNEPQRYGVIEFYNDKKPNKIIEKPTSFVSNYAVPGIYIYDSNVVQVAKTLTPSARNELEITDLNNILLQNNNLNITMLPSHLAWLDCGTPASLLSASNLVASIETRHGKKLGCYEEVAYQMQFISSEQFLAYCKTLPESEYTEYLIKILYHH